MDKLFVISYNQPDVYDELFLQDVICGLEWESIGILTRSRETVARY